MQNCRCNRGKIYWLLKEDWKNDWIFFLTPFMSSFYMFLMLWMTETTILRRASSLLWFGIHKVRNEHWGYLKYLRSLVAMMSRQTFVQTHDVIPIPTLTWIVVFVIDVSVNSLFSNSAAILHAGISVVKGQINVWVLSAWPLGKIGQAEPVVPI